MVLTFFSALFGAVYGLWEEIPAYSMAVVPLFVLAGYDVVTGIGVLTVGATAGNMASVVNPFSIGAAVGAIGNESLSLGSGIVLRLVLFAVLYLVALAYVLQYAARVKKDPSKSIVAGLPVNTMVEEKQEEVEITTRQALSIGLLVLIVIAMICGYVPWDSIKFADGTTAKTLVNLPFTSLAKVPVLGNLLGAEHYTQFGDWYFEEFSFVFLAGALLLGIINKIPGPAQCGPGAGHCQRDFRDHGEQDCRHVRHLRVLDPERPPGCALLGLLPGGHRVLCGHRFLHAVHQRGGRDHHAHPGGCGLCPL